MAMAWVLISLWTDRRLHMDPPVSPAIHVVCSCHTTENKFGTKNGLLGGNCTASTPSPLSVAPAPPSPLPHARHRLGPVRHALGLFGVRPWPPVLLLLLRLAASAVSLVQTCVKPGGGDMLLGGERGHERFSGNSTFESTYIASRVQGASLRERPLASVVDDAFLSRESP